MGNAKFVGLVGALAVALGVRNVRRTATRMTVSIGLAAVVVLATVVPASASEPSLDEPPPDRTALIMCGTTCPTPDEFWIESIKNQFVAPTHPDQDIEYVGVTAPMEFWPITGLFRLVLLAVGPPELWGPGGPGWPDQPLWKLSGLFDLKADESLEVGVADLEGAMAEYGNDHLVIYGNSQGAGIANVEKKRLAAQYPEGTAAPDIDFVLGGDPNLPNGGLMSRFPGRHIPILNLSFNGAAATDTQFHTVEINRQYDGFSDFPLYPLNLIADLNAVLGVVYVHAYGLDVSMAPDAPTSPIYQGNHGDTDYYFFETQDLPLFGPLRTLGVPEPLIDVVEPFFRAIVELGYDRSIPVWEPTPARLIPPLQPAKVATDLIKAIGEGIDNAAALFDGPLGRPVAPATADQSAAVEKVLPSPVIALKGVGRDVGDGVSTRIVQQLADTRDHIDDTITAAKSVIGNKPTVSPARKTPLRDTIARGRADVKKVVSQVSGNVNKTLGSARDKADTRPKRGAGAAA